jgi:hypothetical protein
MAKKNHHYVPQFYLRLFGINDKFIHLYNLKNKLHISEADIKHQCYKRKFYGKNDIVENALAEIEQDCSITIKEIIATGKLPLKGNPKYNHLLELVATQWLRTESIAEEQIQTIESIASVVGNDFPEEFLNRLRNPNENLVLIPLSMAGIIARAIDDLEFHLIFSGAHRGFVTSDNPVVRYNLYNQSISTIGMNGAVSKGILFFLPLSPHYLLLLYDPGVYKLHDTSRVTYYATDKDIDFINLLQFTFANENIYFNDCVSKTTVDILRKKSLQFRREKRIDTKIFDEVGDPERSSLIVTKNLTPNLHFDLSFLKIKSSARKIPYVMRINNSYRRRIPELEYEQPFSESKLFTSRTSLKK